jgi:hypothetical protein
MAEEEKKKPQAQEIPHQISRREFAIGSVAMLSGYAMTEAAMLPPLSTEAQVMKLEISDDLKNIMEALHILEEDLKRVIDHAEKTGEKLYEPGTDIFLSKLRVREAYFYVEYSPIEGGGFKILDTYTHRFLIEEGQL